MRDDLRVIFAGGGTGGHLFPAIAIAQELRKILPSAEILFVGTKGKIEAKVVPQHGYKFSTIWISGFRRGLRFSNLVFPIKVIVSLMQSISIIKKFDPHVVIGTGGYVSGPVVYAATRLKVPTLIQEQNSYPGITTRLLASRVNEVHLTFETTKRHLGRTSIAPVMSGNPTRDGLERIGRAEGLRYFGFDPEVTSRTILVFGGSLGAHSINMSVERHLDTLTHGGTRLIWQTGAEDIERARSVISGRPPSQIWVGEFIDRMECAYAASDLVVCRSGATTIAELTRLGKPALLIPYPHAAANHQVDNARTLADAGAAEMLYDHDVNRMLGEKVLSLLDDIRLDRMSVESRKLGRPDAANVIAGRIIELASIRVGSAAG